MKKRFVCPYCFEESETANIEFRCRNKRCAQEPDDEKGKYYGTASPMDQSVFKPVGKIVDRATCEKCHEQTNLRVCPSCHNTLPSTITSDREKIISLIGTRDSGKSTYVSVLIHEFLKHIAPSLTTILSIICRSWPPSQFG